MNRAFSALMGLATGALVAGLVVPFGLGDRAPATVATAVGPVAQPSDPGSGGVLGPQPGKPPQPASAAPSSGGSSGQTEVKPPEPEGGAQERTAGGTVTLGVLLLEVGGLAQVGQQLGVPSTAEQRQVVEAYLDEVNERGGVNGRRLESAYAIVDPLRTETERAACLALADDADAFAVLGTMVTEAGVLCVTREYRRPLVSPSLSALDSTFEQSGGLLFTNQSRASRAVANLAERLHARRVLDGKTVGVLTSETTDPGGRLAQGLAARVERLGHPAPVISRLDADLSVAASQMPVEVRRMQAAGVDHVMLLTAGLLSAQFVRQAESQRWTPAWSASDVGPMYPDSSVQNMPRSFHGAYLVTAHTAADTKAGIPENADAASCRSVYEERAGIRYERGSNAYGLALAFCTAIATVVVGLDGAGPAGGADDWSRAVQAAGTYPRVSPTWGGGSFGPAKFDMADLIRTNRFDAGCTCWRPAEPFGSPHV